MNGLRPVQTVMPPTIACATMPAPTMNARVKRSRRWARMRHTSTNSTSAMMPTTPVIRRLPNSISEW